MYGHRYFVFLQAIGVDVMVHCQNVQSASYYVLFNYLGIFWDSLIFFGFWSPDLIDRELLTADEYNVVTQENDELLTIALVEISALAPSKIQSHHQT